MKNIFLNVLVPCFSFTMVITGCNDHNTVIEKMTQRLDANKKELNELIIKPRSIKEVDSLFNDEFTGIRKASEFSLNTSKVLKELEIQMCMYFTGVMVNLHKNNLTLQQNGVLQRRYILYLIHVILLKPS